MSLQILIDLTRESVVTTMIALLSFFAAAPGWAAPGQSAASGLPLLAGASLGEHALEAGEGRESESEESGTQYGLSDAAKETRRGVELVVRFDSARRVFAGTLRNGTDATVRQVRVEVHLSNGVELGPTPNVVLRPGQSVPVELSAGSQEFDKFSTHVEIGAAEHGGDHGGREDGEHRGGRGGEHGGREGREHRGRERR